MSWLSGLKKILNAGGEGVQPKSDDSTGIELLKIPEDEDEALHTGDPPSKDEIIEATCFYTCTRVCYGVKGQAGACCMIGERDFIIGPIDDCERFLDDLSTKLGRKVEHREVFIDYEEGSKLFPDRKLWQNPDHYPCMRIVPDAKLGYPCQFLGKDTKCKVHSIKPSVCRNYLCSYLKEIVGYLQAGLDPSDED